MAHSEGKSGDLPSDGKNAKAKSGWDQYRKKAETHTRSVQPGGPDLPLKVSSRNTSVQPPVSSVPAVKPGTPPPKKKQKRHLVLGLVGGGVLLLVLFGLWKFLWAPEPGAETPVGQAVTGLLQKNDKGEAIRAEREREKNEKPFPLLGEAPQLPPLVSPSAINLLIIGRDVEANLYDTLLIMSMDPETGVVRLINIPRDLYVDYGEEAAVRIAKKLSGLNTEPALRKINAAHKLGKLIGYRKGSSRFGSSDFDFTADLIEEMFQLHIDDFMFVHHDAFREIVDEFGGVEVEIARGMRYSDPIQKLRINLAPGVHVLDGVDAEGFVRFRKGYDENGKYYEIGDLGRKENQNLFVKAFLDQHLTIGNLNRIVSLANRYTEFVETSVVGQDKIAGYVQIGKSLIGEKFTITSVVLETQFQNIYGTSHLVLGEGLSNPPKGSPRPVKPDPDAASEETEAPDAAEDAESLPEEGETTTDTGVILDEEQDAAQEPEPGAEGEEPPSENPVDNPVDVPVDVPVDNPIPEDSQAPSDNAEPENELPREE